MSNPNPNNDLVNEEVHIQDRKTGEIYWRLNPSYAVWDAIQYAIQERPKSRLVAAKFPIMGDATKVDPVTDVTYAKRTIHGIIFDAYVRSI